MTYEALLFPSMTLAQGSLARLSHRTLHTTSITDLVSLSNSKSSSVTGALTFGDHGTIKALYAAEIFLLVWFRMQRLVTADLGRMRH